jgi:hypothetical protein
MLTAVLLTQLTLNVLFLLGLWWMLREREAAVRSAEQREDRLEALAKEFCALGSELSREARPAPAQEPATPAEPDAHGSIDRIEGATALLMQGVPVARVAEATALPDGEVEVLKNLRRPAHRSPGAARARQAQPSAEETTPSKRKVAPRRPTRRAAAPR